MDRLRTEKGRKRGWRSLSGPNLLGTESVKNKKGERVGVLLCREGKTRKG